MTHPTKLKLDDTIMLSMVLNGMNMNRAQLAKVLIKEYGLDQVEFVTEQRTELGKLMPGTNTKMYMDELVYRSPNYMIKATKHGRVKKVTKINHPTKPKIVVKKKRTFTK